MSLGRRIFLFFASLKLAVITILLLSGVLAWGTFAESWYGTRGAKVLVYGTPWFGGVLFMLGLNVTCAALSRFPWKRTQTGFVVTHLGIIVLLVGSVMTQRWGVDGSLPVTEKTSSGDVVLSDPMITIREEDSGREVTVPVPESHILRSGDLLKVGLNADHELVLEQYMPRARFHRELTASSVDRVGYPAVRVEIFNDRFNVEEKIVDRNPGVGTDVSLGPARLNFRRLWSEAELEKFLDVTSTSEKKQSIGTVVAQFRGREFRIPIQPGYKTERMLGSTKVEISIDKYYSYAIVKNNELVNKSEEARNPAVQITVKSGADRIEKHTVFRNFPEFPTRHNNKSTGTPFNLGFSVEIDQQDNANIGIVGRGRGQLLLAQGPDDKLYYRVLSKEGTVNGAGALELDKTYETGWMNLRFRVTEWFPYSVERFEPKYVESIVGTDGNFLSAVRLRLQARGGRTTASSGEQVWLMEGSRRSFSLKGKRYIASYNKEELALPFKIFLEEFRVGHDPGTQKAASYESTVKVDDPQRADGGSHVISMNEPLVYAGYTFYQASYQMQEGRPPVSIFSVNWDPGRWVKYAGSLIMCLGICIMFYMNPHYFEKIGFGFLRRKS